MSETSTGGGGFIKRLQCRGAEPDQAPAPLDSASERDFLSERLSLYFSATLFAAGGFFLAGRMIYTLWPARIVQPLSLTEPYLLFHLAAVALLLVMWLAVRQPELSQRTLLAMDAVGTIAALGLLTAMTGNMPAAWRPETIVLLSSMAILLYRAAIVPSAPRRTAWISTLAVLPIPFVAHAVHFNASPDLSAGAAAANAFLWALLAVLLSTIVSFVTFRLRNSVARARRLGQYTLKEKIGEGGMGIVYRAEHEMLRRPTAIKLLPPGAAGENNLRRFEREVQQTARLTSPHTVSIYDYGRTPDGLFYYVMEYLDGVDLDTLVRDGGPIAPGRAVRILRQICAALAEAHGIGLIHRDVKPANILLVERGGITDIAKILDFGLVKELAGSADAGLTAENVLHGTPQYMAPEAIRDSGSQDPRSDLYALGAVGYFLLTGTPVFSGRTALETIHHHLQTQPEPPSKRLGRALPEKLEAVIMACLSKDPDQRPDSAKALAKALGACDDVTPWNEAEAQAWWRDRAQRRSAAKTA
jgi:hypothetical protein